MSQRGANASIHVEVRAVKRVSRWVVFVGVPLLLALTVPAAAGKTLPGRVKQVSSGRITGLALDGPQVVYGVDPGGVHPRQVFVWNVLSGAGRLGHASGGGVEFAVAGKRVAWIARGGSPSETDEYLLATVLPAMKLRQLASAVRTDYDSGLPGGWLSGLVGSGNVIAVSSWTTDRAGTISDARLSLVGSTGLRRIVSGEDGIVAQSVDAGRIVVVRSRDLWPRTQSTRTTPPDSVAVYSTSGKLLVELNQATAKEAALSGNNLAVLTTTNKIELYNAKTGAFVRAWSVPIGSAHLDLQAGIAIYSAYSRYGPRTLHALQVKTGKDVVIATGEAPYPTTQGDDAQIDRLGVVYAVNIKFHGKLVFMPMARVLTAVSKGHAK
jgi:hypothetical protein